MIVLRPRVLREGWTLVQRVLNWPFVKTVRIAYQRYYGSGAHRTSGAAAYYGILTMLPFLALFYLLLAQLAHADPNVVRTGRHAIQSTIGLSPNVTAELYSAEGTAGLRAVLTLLGGIGLLYAGNNWIDAIQQGLWSVWPRVSDQNWWRRYLRRWATLLVTLPSLVLIVLVAVFVGRSPYRILMSQGDHFRLSSIVLLEAVALVVTVVLATALMYLAYRLVGAAPPTPTVRVAALFAGAGVGGLAAVGAFLLPLVLSNPYGIVVAILAIMLWVSGSVRAMLSMAVWAKAQDDGRAPR